MKAKIHPRYGNVLVSCASCGNTFLTASTRLDGAKKEYQGKEFPSMTLEICSQCHPFFSGKQIYVDTAGRVEKFTRRYGSFTGAKPAAEKPAAAPAAAEKPKEPSKAAAPAEPKKAMPPRPPKAGGEAKEKPPKAEVAPTKS